MRTGVLSLVLSWGSVWLAGVLLWSLVHAERQRGGGGEGAEGGLALMAGVGGGVQRAERWERCCLPTPAHGQQADR